MAPVTNSLKFLWCSVRSVNGPNDVCTSDCGDKMAAARSIDDADFGVFVRPAGKMDTVMLAEIVTGWCFFVVVGKIGRVQRV